MNNSLLCDWKIQLDLPVSIGADKWMADYACEYVSIHANAKILIITSNKRGQSSVLERILNKLPNVKTKHWFVDCGNSRITVRPAHIGVMCGISPNLILRDSLSTVPEEITEHVREYVQVYSAMGAQSIFISNSSTPDLNYFTRISL